jgi:hypothetical protein
MNNVVATALVGIYEDLFGQLAPGEYTVDEVVSLRITGTVVKNEDEVYAPTTSVPLLATTPVLNPAQIAAELNRQVIIEEANT